MEFKHAMVSHKRRCKSRQKEEGMAQLPHDVLVHIFSFLDLRSLFSAVLVCRSWNASASDNHLWQLQYITFFGHSDNYSKIRVLRGGLYENKKYTHLQEDVVARVGIDWRGVFKRAYEGSSSKKFITSSRGCCRHCNAIVWLSDMRCSNKSCGLIFESHQIKLVSTQQVVEYIVDDTLSLISSSDSDSDSDGGPISKLWAYPRRSNK